MRVHRKTTLEDGTAISMTQEGLGDDVTLTRYRASASPAVFPDLINSVPMPLSTLMRFADDLRVIEYLESTNEG